MEKSKKVSKIHKSIIILGLIIIILLISNIFSLSKLSAKTTENNQLNNNYQELYSQNNKTITDLNIQISKQQELIKVQTETITSIEEKYGDLLTNHEKLESTINKTKYDAVSFKKEIEESMSWFNNNAKIERSASVEWQNKISQKLERSCIQTFSNTCRINLVCLGFINEMQLGLHYIDDIETSNENDKLQTIKDFIIHNGGDCEDYSLFYKAEMNYLLDVCEKRNADNIYLQSMSYSNDKTDRFFVENEKEWYLDYAKDHLLPKGYVVPNIVCGHMFVNNELTGHCVIAFTKEEIITINDLKLLTGAPIIEPQEGSYLGIVGEDVFLIDQAFGGEQTIFEIITNNDLFLYSDQNEWVSYQTLIDRIDISMNELKAHTLS